MLLVHTAPSVQPRPYGGWAITLWLGDAFDFDIPLRQALDEIVALLAKHEQVSLSLPPYEKDEDFVEGTMRFGAETLGVYFEHTLGYLDLSSPDRDPLDKVLPLLRPSVRVGEQAPR